MAGGEGAKERRRLKRLAAQEAKKKSAESAASPSKQASTDQSKNQASAKRSGGNQSYQEAGSTRRNSNEVRGNPLNRNKSFPKNNSKNFGGAKKGRKPKIKKPKHLKRKLELAANENEETRELIQKQMEEFESKKKFYSKRNNTDRRKRQKTTTSGDGNGVNNIDNEDAVSRLNRINAKRTSFPRGGAVENSQSPIIEDEDDKMTDVKEDVEPEVEEQKDESDSDSDDGSGDDESIGDNTGENESSETTEQGSKGEASDPSSSSENEDDNHDNSSDGSDDDSSSDSDDSSDGDSDDDDDEPVQKRQRGRRRRGRQDTAKKIEEMQTEEKSKAPATTDLKAESKVQDGSSTDKSKKRYCIGRKPVTDFVIGQSHPGKVVYVKPFGVFFDIGCHSDAFCHVSRLSDDYIEKPESMFKEGDEVPKVRIVEIDRKQKRITVSLQSEARIQDERKSIEDRKSRKEKIKQKSKKTVLGIGHAQSPLKSNSRGQDSLQNHSKPNNVITAPQKKEEPVIYKAPPPPSKNKTDPSKMTPAELKRARKLARRAERRAQADQQGQASQ